MIRIVVDSSSDYTREEAESKNMELVPINVTMGENSYLDGIDLDRDSFYQELAETEEFPKTAQPSPQAYLDIFNDAAQKEDQIICLTLSSGLSGTYQTACLCRDMTDYEQIYIVDTLAATSAIRILAEHACTLRDAGESADAIVASLEELKPRIKVLAVLETLEYLHRGGRLSKTAAAIGDLASLKPMITITEEGTIGIAGKSIGKNKATVLLLRSILSHTIDTSHPAYLVYTYGTDNCRRLEEKLAAENIHPTGMTQVGPTIGAHIGPEIFGLIFVTAP